MRLSELKTGESAIVVKVLGHGGFRRRIVEMGFVRGNRVDVLLNAPLKDPIEYRLLGYNIMLRRSEAEMVVVVTEEEALRKMARAEVDTQVDDEYIAAAVDRRKRHINVALVGNPNCGKTSLFNHITGEHEHVGNYSGVTVDAKTSYCHYKGYELHITDLPGTYALSAYSPEELYVRHHLATTPPDVVLNVVCASNLERNLYLTTELIDMSQRMVIGLSMYDELQRNGDRLDHDMLGRMLGVPMVPVMGHTGQGVEELLDTVISVYEGCDERVRHIHISQGVVEESVTTINKALKRHVEELPKCFPPRYFAMKMLEGDGDICDMLRGRSPHYDEWSRLCEKERQHLLYDLGNDTDVETIMADQKYGFISGALRETYVEGHHNRNSLTARIDAVVTHRVWGYPLFALVMWAVFYCTFRLGEYPQQRIEMLVEMFGEWVESVMPAGMVKDMIVDGVIGGVGSVIVFLPNIMILYLLISFMEDSGYLARAAFIMDKLMHKAGLHGKAFIPLVMGFGCNVPAVMSTRIIESRSSRLITTFIIPFMSCSARLPIYIVFIGTFFASYSGTVMTGLYLLGIVVAVLTARIMRRFLFKVDETPFVMELPPYRIPTIKATMSHMWARCRQYLRKMGGMILIASLVVWFLGYFPRQGEVDNIQRQYEESYIGQIGRLCEPVLEPLGLNWKAGVALLSGVAAKEIMVSTMGVLYAEDGDSVTDNTDSTSQEGVVPSRLYERLQASGDFSVASVLALLVFTLLYLPCVATIVAIGSECGWKWAVGLAVYSTVIAWVCSWGVYNLALWLL